VFSLPGRSPVETCRWPPVIAVWPGSSPGKAAHNFVVVARSERAFSLVSTPFEPF
jgi:hypothetical protein